MRSRSQTPISSQPAVASDRERSESPSPMATPRRSQRTASRQSGSSAADSKMSSARRQPDPNVLPILQAKQSFAYGSPGSPPMPRPILMNTDSRPVAEIIAAGVQRARERDARKAAGEPKPPRRPPFPETGRGPRRRLSPIRESPGQDGPPLLEPEGERSFLAEGLSFFAEGKSFFREGGLFYRTALFGIHVIKGLYRFLKDVFKLLFILGLVLTPLLAGWFWGPSLVGKIDISRVSERLSWPSAGSHQDVGTLVNRVSVLEKPLKDSQLVNPQVAPGTGSRIYGVNFFSTGLGAVVDPYVTSPTKRHPTSFLHRRALNFLGLGLRKPLPPVAALEPWDDIGDCWCAPFGKGRAQLGVLLPRVIYPTSITIEHIPSGATLDIAAAPKNMELWAQIPDEQAREAVGDAAFPLLSTADDIAVTEDSLDRTYVRISKWKYNIHAPNHIQTFAMAVDMEHFNAKVGKVVVRAKTNWGGRSYTCLYRVRMHGKLVDHVDEDIPLE
ncbi:MAG: hypothetical protein M1830_001946 [Pleopsidium flavum]|nr:MAG: hypothetical protein M1830_001946 [Pleopsidium flavum]